MTTPAQIRSQSHWSFELLEHGWYNVRACIALGWGFVDNESHEHKRILSFSVNFIKESSGLDSYLDLAPIFISHVLLRSHWIGLLVCYRCLCSWSPWCLIWGGIFSPLSFTNHNLHKWEDMSRYPHAWSPMYDWTNYKSKGKNQFKFDWKLIICFMSSQPKFNIALILSDIFLRLFPIEIYYVICPFNSDFFEIFRASIWISIFYRFMGLIAKYDPRFGGSALTLCTYMTCHELKRQRRISYRPNTFLNSTNTHLLFLSFTLNHLYSP